MRHRPLNAEAARQFKLPRPDPGPDFRRDARDPAILYPETERAEHWMDHNAEHVPMLSGGLLADAGTELAIVRDGLTIEDTAP